MSSALPSVDLSLATVGDTFKVEFNEYVKFNPRDMTQGGFSQIGYTYSQSGNAHLNFFNESGVGLQGVCHNSGASFYIPAGGWLMVNLAPNDSFITMVAIYVIPNAPVAQLIPVYYPPGEEVPPTYTLGNSPIGVSGTVPVTTVDTLSNEGKAPNTLVIDMGDTTFSQIVQWFNDGHILWAVNQTGVAHQVIKVQTAGTPLQLGFAGDVTEVLGDLQTDGNTTLSNAGGNTLLGGSLKVNGTSEFVDAITVDSTSYINALAVGTAINVPNGAVTANNIQAVAGADIAINAGTGKNVTIENNGTPVLQSNNLLITAYNPIDAQNGIYNSAGALSLAALIGSSIELEVNATPVLEVTGSVVNCFQSLDVTGAGSADVLTTYGAPDMFITMHNQAGTQTLQFTTSRVTLNGGTSGTAYLYEWLQGNVKMLALSLSNFKTAGAIQSIQLPSAFSNGGWFFSGDLSADLSVKLHICTTINTPTNIRVVTGFASDASGAASASTQNIRTFGRYQTGNNTVYIGFAASWAVAISAYALWGYEVIQS